MRSIPMANGMTPYYKTVEDKESRKSYSCYVGQNTHNQNVQLLRQRPTLLDVIYPSFVFLEKYIYIYINIYLERNKSGTEVVG